ncbi:FUSC family protein [Desulfobacula sp.]|uniref:FUSC family protein n=1 Tax=Desulfobacula sp. TaxID=2593537 RepID=UPI0026154CD6|nr:FUSC family protein [Desulfobacula sp.]
MNISSTHVIHGLKTALAAVLAYATTMLLNLEFGHWAVISTVIVMQIYVADSIEMCLYRLSGTTVGAILGVLVLFVTPPNSIFIGVALFMTIGICSFLTRYKTRYRMAAITVVIIVMTGIDVENIFIFGLFRVFEIAIGILCAFVISVLVFPKRRVDVLMERLESQSLECTKKCCVLVDAFISKQQNVEGTLVDDLVRDVWENHSLLQKINQHEAMIYRKKLNIKFSDKVSLMNRSVEHLRNMVRTLNSLDDDGYDIIMSPELKKLAEESGKTLSATMKNEFLVTTNKLENMVTDLDIKLLNIRKEGLIRRFDSKKLIQVFSFYSSLQYFAEDILAGAKICKS